MNGGDRRGYVLDAATNIQFTHQFPRRGKLIPEDFLRHYEPFRAKWEHLAERFRATVRTEPVCFVRRDISQSKALKLEKRMRRSYPSADLSFLYVNADQSTFETPLGRSVFLPHPTTGLGDSLAWARLLVDLGLIESPFRLATSQIVRSADDYHLDSLKWYSSKVLREARQRNPENPWFIYELGLCDLAWRRFRRAETLASTALARDPQNLDFLELQMRARIAVSPRSRGKILTELLPHVDTTKHLGLSDVAIVGLIDEGRLDEAADLIDRMSEAHPNSPQLLSSLARILLARGRAPEALAAIDQALALHPFGKSLVEIKARILSQMGQQGEALRLVGCALRENRSIRLRLKQAELACRLAWRTASLAVRSGRTA